MTEQLLTLLDERRREMIARTRGIKAKEGESAAKMLAAFVPKTDQGTDEALRPYVAGSGLFLTAMPGLSQKSNSKSF